MHAAASRAAAASRPRELGFWSALALVMGSMVGSGVFLLPASLAAYRGLSLVGWIVSAIGSVALALVFARLARHFPAARRRLRLHAAELRRHGRVPGGVGLLAVDRRGAGGAGRRVRGLPRPVPAGAGALAGGGRLPGGLADLGARRRQRPRSRPGRPGAGSHDRDQAAAARRWSGWAGWRIVDASVFAMPDTSRVPAGVAARGRRHPDALRVPGHGVRDDPGGTRRRPAAHHPAGDAMGNAADRRGLHPLHDWGDEPGAGRRARRLDRAVCRRRAAALRRRRCTRSSRSGRRSRAWGR